MPAAAAATPRDTLEQKKTALKKAEAAAQTASTTVATLRSEIADLTKSVAQIDQALAGYDKTFARLQAQRDDLAVQVAGFEATLLTLVREKRPEIDAAIKKYDDEVAATATQADKLKQAWEKARDESDAAQQQAADAAQHLTDVKQALRAADTSIAAMTALTKQIHQAMADRNYAGAYFLLTEAEKLTIELPDRATEERALEDASSAADAAAAKAAAASASAKQARAAWQAAIPPAETTSPAARRTAIVDALKKIDVAPPKPAATTATPASSSTAAAPPASSGTKAPASPSSESSGDSAIGGRA
jgi:methyl-accepting chemotaxis protein-1 (serine sensor receptor)